MACMTYTKPVNTPCIRLYVASDDMTHRFVCSQVALVLQSIFGEELFLLRHVWKELSPLSYSSSEESNNYFLLLF
jgi:hypothetical protein